MSIATGGGCCNPSGETVPPTPQACPPGVLLPEPAPVTIGAARLCAGARSATKCLHARHPATPAVSQLTPHAPRQQQRIEQCPRQPHLRHRAARFRPNASTSSTLFQRVSRFLLAATPIKRNRRLGCEHRGRQRGQPNTQPASKRRAADGGPFLCPCRHLCRHAWRALRQAIGVHPAAPLMLVARERHVTAVCGALPFLAFQGDASSRRSRRVTRTTLKGLSLTMPSAPCATADQLALGIAAVCDGDIAWPQAQRSEGSPGERRGPPPRATARTEVQRRYRGDGRCLWLLGLKTPGINDHQAAPRRQCVSLGQRQIRLSSALQPWTHARSAPPPIGP